MRDLYVYVVIDLRIWGDYSGTPQVYGSIKELVNAKIEDGGEMLTYDSLINRLSRNSDSHFWRNERYVIKKCQVKRSRKSTPETIE